MEEEKIYKKIKDKLMGKPEVLAIFNNGSSVVGMNSTNSDLDFVIVIKNEKDEKKLRNILRKSFKITLNEKNPEIQVEEQYWILNKRADFTIISKKKIEEKINKFYKSPENFLELQHFIKHKIVDSISIYDPKKLLLKWKKQVEKYPKQFMKKVFDLEIYSIKEELYYWENHGFRNEFQFNFEQWDLMRHICQALYAKNNQMFMLPYKRLHKDLKRLKPNIEKEMYGLLRNKNTKKTITKKIKIVKKILEKLKK
jgi:hypothetical protein